MFLEHRMLPTLCGPTLQTPMPTPFGIGLFSWRKLPLASVSRDAAWELSLSSLK